MARVNRLSYKEATRAKVAGRFKELVVVFLLAIAGILVSVSLSAQTAGKIKHNHKKECKMLAKKRVYRAKGLKGILKPHWVATTTAPAKIENVKPAGAFEQTIISEMVATHLKETNQAEIELAPLLFNVHENKLTAVDKNPLLIAVEFGKQGKTILIENDDPYLGEELKSVMLRMGVPAERLQVKNLSIPRLSNEVVSQKVNRRVDLKAI